MMAARELVDADDRGGPRVPHRHHDGARRLLGHRAQPAHHAALRGRAAAVRGIGHRHHADAAGDLWRTPAENYFYTRENPHNDAKLQHFTPSDDLDDKTRRRDTGAAGWFRDEEFHFREHAAQVKAIIDAGGKAGIGSHGQPVASATTGSSGSCTPAG